MMRNKMGFISNSFPAHALRRSHTGSLRTFFYTTHSTFQSYKQWTRGFCDHHLRNIQACESSLAPPATNPYPNPRFPLHHGIITSANHPHWPPHNIDPELRGYHYACAQKDQALARNEHISEISIYSGDDTHSVITQGQHVRVELQKVWTQ